MHANPALFGRSLSPPIVYRSQSTRHTGATTAQKPSGIAVGDLVFVINGIAPAGTGAPPNLKTSGGSAWGKFVGAAGSNWGVYWKVLNATDVANAWNFVDAVDDTTPESCSGTGSFAYEGRGATTVTSQQSVAHGTAQASIDFTGFTPAFNSKGVVTVMMNRETLLTEVQPSGFALRELAGYVGGDMGFADRLGSYEGGALSWTGMGSVGGAILVEGGILFEVT